MAVLLPLCFQTVEFSAVVSVPDDWVVPANVVDFLDLFDDFFAGFVFVFQ